MPSVEEIVTGPHPSVALAEPSALAISLAVGLHPSVVVVPVAVMDGGVLSEVHVTVLEAVAVLPHPSLAVNVLICVIVQVDVVAVASEKLNVTGPQASVAVAVPKAALISEAAGLHPSVVVVPVAVMDGGVLSEVHVTVLEAVAVLPQASLAVNVLT